MTEFIHTLNSMNIGSQVEIHSKKCPNSFAKPIPEIGILKSIDKEQGIDNSLTRVVIEQTHFYKSTIGMRQVRPVLMFFYTKNIEDIKIIAQ